MAEVNLWLNIPFIYGCAWPCSKARYMFLNLSNFFLWLWSCLFPTWALPQEAVDSLQPLSSALRASVRGAVTLPGSLHGPIGAGGGAGAPAGPLIPHSIHWGWPGSPDGRQTRGYKKNMSYLVCFGLYTNLDTRCIY